MRHPKVLKNVCPYCAEFFRNKMGAWNSERFEELPAVG